MICDSILDAIGNTPIIRLRNMTDEDSAEILVKFEGLGVGGSIKTRTAYSMITDAEERGLLNKDSIIVEPTSGNQGIGLALIGAVRGYKVKIIMPDSVSEERRKLVRQYGAEVILVHDEGNIGLCIEECMKLAMRMKSGDPHVFVPGQFDNPANPRVQKNSTAREIIEQVDGPIHGFCSGIGTGGTITGIGEALREKYPDIVVWAAEPERAAILSGGLIGTHVQMGIGDGIIPPVLNRDIISDICIITDDEALSTAKALAKNEGILCGISSGTNVASAIRLAKILGKGKTVVTVLPDTAERYFSTPLFDSDM
jgi:cysteine synthase A